MNKKIGIIAGTIIIVLAAIGVFLFFNSDGASLTVNERSWIEDNRNTVVDFATINDIPIVSNNGNGLIFDFLTFLEEETDINLNELSYEADDTPSTSYSLMIKDTVEDSDLLLYQDDYVLISNEDVYYAAVDELIDLKVGTLSDDEETIKEYLDGSQNLTYTSFDNYDSLDEALTNDEVDVIALPRLDYLEEILSSDEKYIVYNIAEYKINYVISLGDNETLNSIITKYFESWYNNSFSSSFSTYLASSYFNFKGVSESEQTAFRSRRYTYGFVVNAPYDIKLNGSLVGFNHTLIDSFAQTAGIEIDYKQYSSIQNLANAFDSGDVDIVLNNFNTDLLESSFYSTISIYDSKVAIVTDSDTDLTVNNIASLKEHTILTIAGSRINKILKENDIETKAFDNIQDLIKNLSSENIAAIDEYTYDYYVRSDLKNYKNLQTIDIASNYNFISQDDSSLEVLNDFFNFYLSFTNVKEVINQSYNNLLLTNDNSKNLQLILSCLVIILLAIAAIITKIILGKRKDINSKLSKTDKLRYVDALTSLKNRNYLNDNIATWDSSEAYPQAVIIVDLNNIAYINDNFGHAEGDKVIVEAASTLINNQLSGSEILRTNGNEFLIFTIGHDEKSVVTYIRKLNKEFKELSHGFGAAIGYSMINDEIKTIDDAINEATLDMRSNKEEVNS